MTAKYGLKQFPKVLHFWLIPHNILNIIKQYPEGLINMVLRLYAFDLVSWPEGVSVRGDAVGSISMIDGERFS